jgi:hypothetical protein
MGACPSAAGVNLRAVGGTFHECPLATTGLQGLSVRHESQERADRYSKIVHALLPMPTHHNNGVFWPPSLHQCSKIVHVFTPVLRNFKAGEGLSIGKALPMPGGFDALEVPRYQRTILPCGCLVPPAPPRRCQRPSYAAGPVLMRCWNQF